MLKNNVTVLILLALAICSGWLQANTVEPDYCKLLQPSSVDRLALPEWLLGSGDMLKQQGCWGSYNKLGAEVLDRTSLAPELRGRLALKLASSSFYSGDYERCLELALLASALSGQQPTAQKILRTQVESLYLQSAVARVNQQTSAVTLAEEALALAETSMEDRDFLVAKSLYNLGAALTDVSPVDLSRANKAFIEAEKRFTLAGSQYDQVRSVIRQARVLYLKQRYQEALDRLNTVEDLLEQPRSKMLFFQQRSKILVAMKHWQQAQENADIALELAQVLGAEKDQRRIQELLNSIDTAVQ